MANDCTTALAKAEEAFKIDFTIISLHAVRADCLKRSGDAAKADAEDAKSGQALIRNPNGSLYDVISATSRKNGEKLSVYFDVGLIFAGQASRAAAGLPPTK